MNGCRRTGAGASAVFVAIFLAFGVVGCATWHKPTSSIHVGDSGTAGACADFFRRLDAWTVQDGAVDSGTARIESYPYLRANRFIASFESGIRDDAGFSAWIERMQRLDRQARQWEIANLSDQAVADLSHSGNRQDLQRRVAHCSDLLRSHELSLADERHRLRNPVRVPDDYLSARRILGLYPVTRLFVSRGVGQWHREERTRFSILPPVNWRSIRFVPFDREKPSAAAAVVQGAPRDALGIPHYDANELEILFRTHAPIWQVQFHGEDDRIGRPYWRATGAVGVDLDRPETFVLLNHTRFGNAVLTQLNYVIWFPSRPKRSAVDLYGGLLDGLTYRVTLDTSGQPILFETVHNCGCYYKAYRVQGLKRRESIDYAEEPLVLEAPKLSDPMQRLVVAMESGAHFVRHLYANDTLPGPEDTVYHLRAYAELKSLPKPDGKRQSLFNRYGLVAGTERLERFVFWPTGVHSPGAMRQWGRHAVAFVGKRHFDDPFYLDKIFVRSPGEFP